MKERGIHNPNCPKMGLMHLYAESDHRRCGMARASSKWNWNLVKAELGHPRRVTHRIRDPHFIYGRPGERGALGVKEVIEHPETVAAPPQERYGADFKKMNKAAAIHHYCKANEQRTARERFFCHIQPKKVLNTTWKLPSDNNPNHRYGISHPGDGNFETLIAGGYQDDWVDMNEYFKSRYPEKHAEAPRRMEVITNKTFELSKDFIRDKFHSQAPPKKRFILSRFQNVPKRIDNYNYTELNRAPPYHKPHGCGGRHAPPPGGIYKI